MTTNSINSAIPIEISKGGTNATSLSSTHGVAYYDGTQIVTATVGNASQILTSNGAGVAPTMQTLGGNTLYFIDSKTANNDASLDFTTGITTAYTTYLFLLSDVIPATSLAYLVLLISEDGGASYLNANYEGCVQSQTFIATAVTNANATSYMLRTGGNDNVAPGINGYVFLSNLGVADQPSANGNLTGQTVPPGPKMYKCYGKNTTVNGIDAVRWVFSAGNVTSGRISLFGLKEF